MCEKLNAETVRKWHEWLLSEEGLKVMSNVAEDIFVLGKEDKFEWVKSKKVNND